MHNARLAYSIGKLSNRPSRPGDSLSSVASITICRGMPTIYISDSGDEKNDRLSPQTAIYSLKRGQGTG